jgi:peptidylprolyl isomerase
MKEDKAKAARDVRCRKARVHYIGRLEDGTVFDSSREGEPIVVPFGQKRVIRGFEEALLDMSPREPREVKVTPEKGYGPYRPELVTEVDRGKFPGGLKLQIGQHLQLTNPAGMATRVRVTALTEERATLDANHPLAGKILFFDLEVLELL